MSTLGVQSPVNREPPNAPKPRKNLLKSFNGSMLFLVNPKTDTSFATVDPERNGGGGGRGGAGAAGTGPRTSFLRGSDLFSLGRSSASSFGSRGSFSGFFPANNRPASTPFDDDGSRGPSPANTPRTTVSHSRPSHLAEGDLDGDRHSTSSSGVLNSAFRKKNDLTRKIRSTFKRQSSLGKSSSPPGFTTGINTSADPATSSLPSYIKQLKPATTPVTMPNSSIINNASIPATPVPVATTIAKVGEQPVVPKQQLDHMSLPGDSLSSLSYGRAGTESTVDTTSFTTKGSVDFTSPSTKSSSSGGAGKATTTTSPVATTAKKLSLPSSTMEKSNNATITEADEHNNKTVHENNNKDDEDESEEEEDSSRSKLLRQADLETIHVLTSRIGDEGSAKVVVRIARAAQAWMRYEANRLITTPNVVTKPRTRFVVEEEEEETEEDNGEMDRSVSSHFYGEKRPKIALDRYIGRLVRYLDSFGENGSGVESVGMLSLIGGCVLIDRLASRKVFNLDDMNTHRIFMVATLVALKMLDDEPCSNEYYANVGGVDLAELNALEITFLNELHYETALYGDELASAMQEFIGKKKTKKVFTNWYEFENGYTTSTLYPSTTSCVN